MQIRKTANNDAHLQLGVRSAPHDGDREGDVRARGNGEFPKVESRTGLVVTEKQIPGLFVGSWGAPSAAAAVAGMVVAPALPYCRIER
jgi:hypothetical protein